VTVAAWVKYRTASAMSWTVEGRPIGERLSITSFGVFRCSGVETAPGAGDALDPRAGYCDAVVGGRERLANLRHELPRVVVDQQQVAHGSLGVVSQQSPGRTAPPNA
jgi:hypothetical protein